MEKLLEEIRKIDDKHLLVEILLLESRIWMALENNSKAKSSLTAAKSSANSIYVPPLLQAQIDFQSALIQSEDNDFKTAFSYFYEAFEAYHQSKHRRAGKSFKYMLIAKIMNNEPDDVYGFLNGKHSLHYNGREFEAVRAIADASKTKSLLELKKAKQQFKQGIHRKPP